MSTGNNEPGKLCLVVRQDVHLAHKCGECVRSGNAFVTTAHREDGKQRKLHALLVIPTDRLILIPTGRRPMVTFRPILFVIPTDRREWRNLPGELCRAPAAGNALRSG